MPYVTFPAGTLPGFGLAHADKAAALAYREAASTGDCPLAVGFDPSLAERDAWHWRERRRFGDGTYSYVPWADCLRDIAANEPIRIDTESEGKPEAGIYRAPFSQDEQEKATRLLLHFAHMSVSHPGMIAYTENDEKGHEDKQLRVSVGRYLERFGLPGWDKGQCEEYIGTVKAVTGETLNIARTPEDIARVYCANDAPGSCMDGGDFSRHDSPVRVYGNSDLAVAYLGTLHATDPDKDTISARGVIWPAKKLHSRLYGDYTTLAAALQAHGYTTTRSDLYSSSGNDAGMAGARIRAISRDYGGYVMPYVDDANGAKLTPCGEYFVLTANRSDYSVKETCGYVDGGSDEDLCPHCYSPNDGNGEGEHCDDCRDNVYSCDDCGDSFHIENEGATYDHGSLCGSCNRQHRHDCEHCSERFNAFEFSRRERNERDMRFCASCEDAGVTTCDECDCTTEEVDDNGHCPDCAEKAREAEEAAEAEAARLARLEAARPKPRPRGAILRVHSVTAPVAYTAAVLSMWRGESRNDVRA